ncbi:MAG: integrase [Alphaproteobacteria bacterium]|nr:MAG: integrase [Alphaproteobacteria bacterium]
MATFRKNGSKWRAEVRIKGNRASKSFQTKLEAQSWAVEKEKEFGRSEGILNGKSLKNAFERYARDVSPLKKGARWEIIRLKKLGRHSIANIQLNILSPEDIKSWIADSLKSISSSSVKRELQVMSSVIEKARKDWKWIEKNPCKDVDKPKEPPPRDRRISDNEIEKITKGLFYQNEEPIINQYQEIAVAFLLAIETAMRQGEIWSLTWDNVFLDRGFLTLPITKNGFKRDVPLSTDAVTLLKKMNNKGGKVFKSNQQSCGAIFRRIVKLANIENLTFHDTRHEALTRLARKLDMLDLARMVGHRDPRSLMIYYNATAEEISKRLG